MKYLIVDDEPIAHRIIEGYAKDLAFLEKVGNAYGAPEASSLLALQVVDLIFLDINMPGLTGFEWLKTLPRPPAVIVTTAYREYALEGFELSVVDYLLKPFSFARFLRAVNKVSRPEVPVLPTPKATPSSDKYFFTKGDKKYHKVDYDAVLFVEAYGNYVKIYLREEVILSHEKISNFEAMLVGKGFLRVHKSYLVAVDKIQQIQGNMLLLEGHTVPVGQTYRGKIRDLLAGR
ncbi:MAG: LytTR family DNA-binding domain-containing protein [Bacteroidota bacterium]